MRSTFSHRAPRVVLGALWAAFLLQTLAAAWQADHSTVVAASAGLAAGAVLLFGLSAATVVARRGVTLLGAWSLWILLVGSTAQLAGVAWSLGLRAPLAHVDGAELFHFVGTVLALLGLLLVGLRGANTWSAHDGRRTA